MSLPRPKLLTEITVPSGGWDLRMSIDNGGAYNQNVDVTLAAGTYFMAWDGQDDDFLEEIHSQAYTGLVASGNANYNATSIVGKPVFTIDSDHKVNFYCSRDMRLDWTALDGASIAAVLGFDSSTTTDNTGNNTVTATWPHAYGWYADDDFNLLTDKVEDIPVNMALQSRAPAGNVTTQYIATVFESTLSLQLLTRAKTWSRDTSYATASVDPYVRNVALECWWKEAREGKRFRYYRNNVIDTAKAEEYVNGTSGSTTTIVDSTKAWTTDPQEYAGKLLIVPTIAGVAVDARFYISSNTATQLTLPNDLHNTALSSADEGYIFDQRYSTYVLDLERMARFDPMEQPNIDRYNIDLPLRKYVA